jgi:hypothetical protein
MPGLQLPQTVGMQRRANFGFLTHEQVETAGKHMASSTFGSWVRKLPDGVEKALQVVRRDQSGLTHSSSGAGLTFQVLERQLLTLM